MPKLSVFRTIYLILLIALPLPWAGCEDDRPTEPELPDASLRVVFASDRDGGLEWNLYSVRLDGTDVRKFPLSSPASGGSVSSDGTRLAFVRYRGNHHDIAIADIDGKNERFLTSEAYTDYRPMWSPVDDLVAFVRIGESENRDIWVIRADGTGLRRLTTAPREDTHPVFSHDGMRVIFTSFRSGEGQIYAVNIDGTEEVNLSQNEFRDSNPGVHPAGDHFLFLSNRTGEWDFWRMNLDGTGQTRQLALPHIESMPSYTPDGKWIVYYASDPGKRPDIFIVRATGGTPIALTTDPANESKISYFIKPW